MSAERDSFYRDVSAMIRGERAAEAIMRLEARLAEDGADAVSRSLLGSALLRAGRPEDALAVLREAVAREPGSSRALGDLGYACVRAGRHDDALEALARAVELDPAFHAGWSQLSRIYYLRHDKEAAREAFRRAADCDPLATGFPAVQRAMGEGRLAEAERLCREFLGRIPGHPRSAYTLAQLASKVGAHEEAAAILERALGYYPADVNLRAARVVALEESGDYAAALDEARRLAELDPGTTAAWLVLGRVHGHCGHYFDCLDCYDRALGLAPDDATRANLQLLRGHVLKIVGRRDESIAAYRESLALQEGNGAAWWGLADMKTLRFSADDERAMRRLLADEGQRPEQRAQAAFALGKAAEDRGDHAAAFDHYAEGNALRPDPGFDPESFARGIAEIERVFERDLLATQASPRPAGPRPIFVVGLPRSGSTLVEQILASHSAVEGTMELATLPNVVRRLTIEGGRHGLDYPASMTCFSQEDLADWGRAYLDDSAMYRADRPYFIDKLPTNFDKVGLIHMILPDAIVVDARRHPLDCGLSCFRQHFAGGHPWSRRLEHIAAYYRGYLELMDHWEAVLPGKVHCVRYERMVADTEAQVRALLAHCGLPFEDACLRFFENRRAVRTASSEQVRQPIYDSSIGRWRRYERQLAPLADALGEDTLARFAD